MHPPPVSGPGHDGRRSERTQAGYDANQKCQKQHDAGGHGCLLVVSFPVSEQVPWSLADPLQRIILTGLESGLLKKFQERSHSELCSECMLEKNPHRQECGVNPYFETNGTSTLSSERRLRVAKKRLRRYTKKFRRMAVERLKTCDNIVAVSQ